ncbi:MAG TPA: D-alanyl-D-alanine carboxypeptidase family protein, partial [Acidimicrobiales bacterium]|nr:D-alanyl-D-alanine carboxypeptidase family protein [Acidimicrobiales bacterium]
MALIVAVTATPTVSDAQQPTPEQQRDEVRRQAAEAALEIDTLMAEDAVVQQALADLQANVDAQQADANAAADAQAAADAALADATAKLTDAQNQVATLDAATDAMVAQSFMDPPMENALDIFRSGSLTDAAVKQALLKLQADHDAALMDQLEQAQAQLATDQAAKQEAATVASDRKAASDAALAELQTALGQQQQFAADLEARLNSRLAEADALRQQDAALSAQIEAQQAALAAQLAAVSAGSGPANDVPPGVIAPAPGGLATVSCPTGGSITVAGAIADSLAALLRDAAAAGVRLCGGGYRDPQAQIQVRMANCGTSNYAIYQMPASQCSPPTAIPGTSQHELGLAVDFTCNGGGTVTRSSSCFSWLSAHAADYGFYNLPVEAWHWSTTG